MTNEVDRSELAPAEGKLLVLLPGLGAVSTTLIAGVELARRASASYPKMKIMFITGFAAVALNPDNQAPKDAKILSKPFHLRELVTEIDRILAPEPVIE